MQALKKEKKRQLQRHEQVTFFTKALRTAWATSFSVFKCKKAYSVSVSAAAKDRGRGRCMKNNCCQRLFHKEERSRSSALLSKLEIVRPEGGCRQRRTLQHVRWHVAYFHHGLRRHLANSARTVCRAQRGRRGRGKKTWQQQRASSSLETVGPFRKCGRERSNTLRAAPGGVARGLGSAPLWPECWSLSSSRPVLRAWIKMEPMESDRIVCGIEPYTEELQLLLRACVSVATKIE